MHVCQPETVTVAIRIYVSWLTILCFKEHILTIYWFS